MLQDYPPYTRYMRWEKIIDRRYKENEKGTTSEPRE
jgi:hypothetical protein